MIVVIVTYDMDPEDRERFVLVRREQVEISLGEPGCLEYAFSYDAADVSRVRLVERWTDQASLDAHIEAIAARGGTPTDVTVHARNVTVVTGEAAG